MSRPLPTRVWHLAMDDPAALRPAREREGVAVPVADVPSWSLSRRLYEEIGREHHWLDRLVWDEARWRRHVEGVETLLPSVRGTPAGLAELRREDDGTIDLYVFGILPAFQGQGVGGVALTAAVRRAWASGARRVTVNTCELDGPHALANYLARGFVVARETIELRRRLGGPVSEIRDGDLPGEAAGLEALQLRASLVWDEYREQLAAEPGVVALPADGRVRVAVGEDGRRLGFSVVLPRSGAGAWELDGLFVEPDVQGRGVGRLLVNDVVGAARAAGVARIDVVAGPARAFYERLGFTVTGDAPTRFGPAHRMSRAL